MQSTNDVNVKHNNTEKVLNKTRIFSDTRSFYHYLNVNFGFIASQQGEPT